MRKLHQTPIYLAADANYAPYLATLVCSIILNSSYRHIFICLTDGVNISAFEPARKFAERHDSSFEFIIVDAEDYSNLKTFDFPSLGVYYRLAMFKHVTSPRALYLDADMLVTSDISDLLECELGGKAVGVVADAIGCATAKIAMNDVSNYFNSGMMIFNMEKFDRSKFVKSFFERYHQHINSILYADQCVLNNMLETHTQFLPKNFNLQLQSMLTPDQIPVFGVDGPPAILHYNSNVKPWMTWCPASITDFWLSYARFVGISRENIMKEPVTVFEHIQLARMYDAFGNHAEASAIKNKVITHFFKKDEARLSETSS